MSHKHIWAIDRDYGAVCYFEATNKGLACDATLNLREIEHRLNATECLSEKGAKIGWVLLSDVAVEEVNTHKGEILAKVATEMCDYARVLEGKE